MSVVKEVKNLFEIMVLMNTYEFSSKT